LGYWPGDFPVTEQYSNELLSLPMFLELKREAIAQVVTRIKDSITILAASNRFFVASEMRW
jgi:dTDP-4-amino-4,6-dideoxygalactose transaminase